jgi:hypothetical protein
MVNASMAYTCDVAPGAHKDFYASFLRGAFATAATTGALTNITATATAPHFIRAAGSFLTDGFKVGDVVQATGFTATGVANNVKNFVIYAVTALQMSVFAVDGSAVAARASGDTVTIALKGKKVFTPASGHVRDYYTVEDWRPDEPSSILYTDMRAGTLNLSAPADGMATLTMDFMGRNAQPPTSTVYFASPTAAQAGNAAIGVTGLVLAAGVVIGYVNSVTLSCSGNLSTEAVLGTTLSPDVFDGAISVTGSFVALKADDTFHTALRNESDISLVCVVTAGTGASAEFVSYNMPRIKVLGQSVDDNAKALKQTINFECAYNDTAGADGVATQIIIQDSLA